MSKENEFYRSEEKLLEVANKLRTRSETTLFVTFTSLPFATYGSHYFFTKKVPKFATPLALIVGFTTAAGGFALATEYERRSVFFQQLSEWKVCSSVLPSVFVTHAKENSLNKY